MRSRSLAEGGEERQNEGGGEMERRHSREGGTKIKRGKRSKDVEGDKEGKERGVMEIRRQRSRQRNKRVCQRWPQR